ncbi:MAG: hypothetical protein ACTSRU_11115 [Candidatus Hodarchaeales archaeon]
MQVKALRTGIFLFCSVLLILLSITMQPLHIQATYQNDPLNDVWSENEGDFGDYGDNIDIQQVVLQGSTIEITVDGSIGEIGDPAYFLALLSDDGVLSDFEAAIVFYIDGDSQGVVYWTIGNPFADTGVDWNLDYTGSHSIVNTNLLKLNFREYDKISFSETVIGTYISESGENYFDWAPDFYAPSFFRNAFQKIITDLPPTSIIPPSSTTTAPTTTATTTTTTTATTTTTTTATTTTTTTTTTSSPETSTTTSTETSSTSTTTPSSSTESITTTEVTSDTSTTGSSLPVFTPGFQYMLVFLTITVIITVRKQKSKK